MATKKLIWVLFGLLAISAWVLGSSIQAEAATLNYKYYTYVTKGEGFPIADVEGHMVFLQVRKSFYVFENGEVGIGNFVITGDLIKFSGPFDQYGTITFPDKSTIIFKTQGKFGGDAASMKSEILKGTGRFEGIKGTVSAKGKYLPQEKDEPGMKGYGEGTFTYTLSSK
jgi:hypothetical protein